MRYLLILVASWLLGATQSLAGSIGWTPAERFSFQDVYFDLATKTSGVGDRTSALVDCSDAQFYCLRSEIANISLPRVCSLSMKVGDRWNAGGVVMAVVGEVDEPKGHLYVPGDPLLILQPAGNRNFAILYKRNQGPLAIFYDPAKDLDLSWARPLGGGDFAPVYRNAAVRATYKETEDRFALCRTKDTVSR